MRALLLSSLLALTLAPRAAHAADVPLTITDAVKKAAEGNMDLRRENINIRIAQAGVLSAEGRFDFILTGNASFTQTHVPSISIGGSDINSGLATRLGFGAGISRALETGGNISLQLTSSRSKSTSPNDCGVGSQGGCQPFDLTPTLRFDHPLLEGFGTEFTLANLRRQKIGADLAKLNREARVASVLRDVATAYWELAFASQDLEIRKAAVELAQKQLDATEAQIQVGRMAPIDRAAVERAIADRRQEVLVAKQNLYFQSLTVHRLFGEQLGPGMDQLLASELPNADAFPVDVPAELASALERNPQLRSIRGGLALNELDIVTARSLLKPVLNGFVQVGTRGHNTDAAETFAQASGIDYFNWSTGLTFQMPVQNRVARGQMEVARATKDGAWLDAAALERDIRDSVLRFADQIQTSSQRLELARVAVDYAKKNLEAEEAHFSVGRATNNDVLLRQQELKVAQSAVIRTTVDLLESEIALQAVTGDLLEHYGVMLKGT